METSFALLALCAGNSPVTGEFPSQRPVTRSFDVFFFIYGRINGWVNNREVWDAIALIMASLWCSSWMLVVWNDFLRKKLVRTFKFEINFNGKFAFSPAPKYIYIWGMILQMNEFMCYDHTQNKTIPHFGCNVTDDSIIVADCAILVWNHVYNWCNYLENQTPLFLT